jgi:hypothetical protein
MAPFAQTVIARNTARRVCLSNSWSDQDKGLLSFEFLPLFLSRLALGAREENFS